MTKIVHEMAPISSIKGEITLPGSKSLTNRLLLLSALAQGSTRLTNLLLSEDTEHMLTALSTLGVDHHLSAANKTCTVHGLGGRFPPSNNTRALFLGNAGTAIRPLTAALSLTKSEFMARISFHAGPYDSDDSDQEASLLGEGSFGTTHRMRNTDDGLVYAVKLIKIKKTGVPIEKLQQEAVRLSKLNHPNIVRYFTAFRLKKDKFFAIAMEYLAGGSLLAHIEQESGPLTSGQRQREAQTERWARQVASALAYMHALRMQHRDLKPDNVLFDEHQNARIIDLGLAEVVLAKSKVSSAGGANAVLRAMRERELADSMAGLLRGDNGRVALYLLGMSADRQTGDSGAE